jgi:hypothetical protein
MGETAAEAVPTQLLHYWIGIRGFEGSAIGAILPKAAGGAPVEGENRFAWAGTIQPSMHWPGPVETPKGMSTVIWGELAQRLIAFGPNRQFNEDSGLEMMLAMGEKAVADLTPGFRSAHDGQHVAITLDGKVIATAPTLGDLNRLLASRPPTTEYYVTQLGKNSLATVD